MSPNTKGRYEGRAVVELLDEGRVVSLVEAFSYIDYLSQRWDVPSGAKVDGASIPRALWGLIGAPFEGRYRNASIIHDWFCDRRNRPWQRVHEIFYEAMLTSGVSKFQASMLYAGVRLGGPRWSSTAVSNNNIDVARATGIDLPHPSLAPGPAGVSRSGHFTFAVESKPGAVRTTPKRRTPGKSAKPAAYRYELKDSDLKMLEDMAHNDLDLSAINKLVDNEVKGRVRK
jgi:hypothetical protein